jgi:phenylalanine-4-hydroxylase
MVMTTTAQESGLLTQSRLRGDYAPATEEFIIEQNSSQYSKDEHQRWSLLFKRQKAGAQKFGSSLFCNALTRLEQATPLHIGIPKFSDLNPTLIKHTGWKIVAVPGLIPDNIFFAHLAKRQFPVTTWIRRAHEIDYIVEPDVFHDFFGHVPLLLEPSVANFLQWYGERASQADDVELRKLARLYWYTIEYGLIQENNSIKAFGAGLLTSRTELEHSIKAIKKHFTFDTATIRSTNYVIDSFQTQYFVLNQLQDLLEFKRLIKKTSQTDKAKALID